MRTTVTLHVAQARLGNSQFPDRSGGSGRGGEEEKEHTQRRCCTPEKGPVMCRECQGPRAALRSNHARVVCAQPHSGASGGENALEQYATPNGYLMSPSSAMVLKSKCLWLYN